MLYSRMPPKKGNKVGQKAAAGMKQAANGGGMEKMRSQLDQLLSRIPRGTFATVGGALGGPKGAMIGKGISTITGYGDYNVRNNSLLKSTAIGEMADQVPVFRNQGADTRVKHCEFVQDLLVPETPSAFINHTYNIDPTDSTTFPWLASVARKYQRYKVKGMVIGYRSTSTDYNNSGVVAISVNYDPAEVPYESMEGLLNTKFAVSTKPSISMLAPVECDPSRSPDGFYIKHVTSTDVTDASIRQTMLGKINVATSGLTLPAGSVMGQLYISYDVELIYPYLHKMQDPDPGPTPPVAETGQYVGVLDSIGQSSIDNDFSTFTTGILEGTLATTSDVRFDWDANANSASKWYKLWFPPGVYEVWMSEGGVDGGVGLGTASQTVTNGANVTLGSFVEKVTDDNVRGYYYITVTNGPDNYFQPISQLNRTGSRFVAYSIFIKKLV